MSTLQAELEVSSSAAALTHQMQVEAPPLRQPMSHERRYKLLREILLALELIHRNNMCHLDIKPENIFLKTDQYKLGVSIAATRVPICRAV
jgi:serine/threonine protein kinase